MFKRVMLFLMTNLLVIATISIVMNVLGIQPYLTSRGIDFMSLAIFCGLWGMAGSFISLALSKFIAKRAMGVRVINPSTASGIERQLLNTVHTQAQRAGLRNMPEVGIYNSPELNAFATGATRNSALVAVSTGLLNSMAYNEVEGVLGHEVTHIANGDMVTMALLQGVVNAFAMFLSRIVAYTISNALSDREGDFSYLTFRLLSFAFDILFTFLGSFVVAAFSRWREFRADAGGAKLAGKEKMIAALQRLQAGVEVVDRRGESLNSLKISHQGGLIALLASHPPLEVGINRLQQGGQS